MALSMCFMNRCQRGLEVIIIIIIIITIIIIKIIIIIIYRYASRC